MWCLSLPYFSLNSLMYYSYTPIYCFRCSVICTCIFTFRVDSAYSPCKTPNIGLMTSTPVSSMSASSEDALPATTPFLSGETSSADQLKYERLDSYEKSRYLSWTFCSLCGAAIKYLSLVKLYPKAMWFSLPHFKFSGPCNPFSITWCPWFCIFNSFGVTHYDRYSHLHSLLLHILLV